MEPIKKPGVYSDIPMEVYHGQDWLDAPSISSSGLRAIEQKSPAHFFAGWSGNPKSASGYSPALSFGSAAHALILGDENFHDRHVISPYDDFRSKAAREWRDEQVANGKQVITSNDLKHIEGMAEKLQPFADVFQGDVEQSVVWKRGDVWLKSRMDVRPMSDTLADYKTTANSHPGDCERSIAKFGYYQQFALGVEGLWATEAQKIQTCLLIFQEKEPPYAVTPIELDQSYIISGARQNARALAIFQDCLSKGEWPGYYMPPAVVPPLWLERRLEIEEMEGTLPKAPQWLEEAMG